MGMGTRMHRASNATLGWSMVAGAVIAAIGLGAHPVDSGIQAAPTMPAQVSPQSPPASPSPEPGQQQQQQQQDDSWAGQGSPGGAPGAGGGG